MLERALQHYFGFSSFRPGQEEVIRALLANEDVVALLPTGTGKSLCYQLTGRLKEAPVLIISPLLSLMQDQVNQMKKLGFKRVVALNSFLTREQFTEVLADLAHYDYIFVSPEMLQNVNIGRRLKQLPLGLIVVDEAHCISEWGHDFRPDYLRLNTWLKYDSRPPIVALTATATSKVLADIKDVLCIKEASMYLAPIDRKEIRLARQWFTTAQEKVNWIEEYVSTTLGPGIIYTSSRKKTEQLTAQLRKWRIKVAAYHGGMTNEDRQLIQEQFLAAELEWIVATSAFGMGVHKNNIRHVIHETMSPTLSGYMQEIGRAARDGQDALATVLCTEQDKEVLQFLHDTVPTEEMVRAYYAHVSLAISDSNAELLKYLYANYELSQAIVYCQTLQVEKNKAFQATKNYMETSKCLRATLLQYFEQATVPQQACCTQCGLNVEDYKEVRKFTNLSKQSLDWALRLQQMLLK